MKRKRPSRLWLFFWGRQRRGFPGLLVGVLTLIGVLALIFALPGGEALSRYFLLLTISVLVLVILASLVVILIAFLRPRGRR